MLGAADDAQPGGNFVREHGDIAVEERAGNLICGERFDVEHNFEARLAVADLADVTHLMHEQIGERGRRLGNGRGDETRRTGAARDELQAVEHGDAVRAGRDVDEERLTGEHRHVAEDDVLLALLPGRRGFPGVHAGRRERAEFVRAAAKGKEGVLLAGHVGIGVAIEVKMIAAGLEPMDGDGDVAAVLREDECVEHRVAAGIAPDAGRVGDGERDAGVAAIGEFEVFQLAIHHELGARKKLRLVMAVEIPEIIRRLPGRGESRFRALRADAEIDVEQRLRLEGCGQEQEGADGTDEVCEWRGVRSVASCDWPALTPALSPRRGGATNAPATGPLSAALDA